MIMFLIFLSFIFLHSSAAQNMGPPEDFAAFPSPLPTPTLPPAAYFPGFPAKPEFTDHRGSGGHASQPFSNSCKIPGVQEGLFISREAKLFLTEPLMTTVIPSIYVLVFIISVPLNAAAVFMISFRVRPKKPSAIYMLNLAIADLLFVLLLPFKVSYHFSGNNWVYGPAMCRVVTFAFYCNMYCSVLLIMSISADRFLAVVFPLRSLTWRSQRNAIAGCSFMWLLAITGAMPLLMFEQTMCLPELGITTCLDVIDVRQLRSYYLYFFPIFSCLFFFIPLIVTAACYMCIIHALHHSSTSKRSKKTRAVVMAVTVLIVFIVCFTPSNVLLLAHYAQFSHQHSDGSYIAYLVSVCIGSVNCCLDPVIYYFGSSQCRKNMARLFRCQGPPSLQSETPSTSRLETFQGNVESQCKGLRA